jgi:hypothetical protein
VAGLTSILLEAVNTPVTLQSDGVSAWRVKSGTYTRAAFQAWKNNTDQSGVASSTLTKVTFGTEVFDYAGTYDASTSIWTPPQGLCAISASVLVNAGVVDGAFFNVHIYRNGSQWGTPKASTTASGTTLVMTEVCQIFRATGTDTFEIYVNVGGAGDKTISGGPTTRFSGWML